jgi:hypothetical protein
VRDGTAKRRPEFGRDFGLGWVGFVHSPTVLAQAIAAVTLPDREGDVIASHAFVVTGPDECVEANLPDGVVLSRLREAYLDRDDRWVVFRRPRGLTEDAARRVAERARAQVGTKFDFGGFAATAVAGSFVGQLLQTLGGEASRDALAGLLHQRGRFFCNDLIAFCLRPEPPYAGIDILRRPPGTVSPQALFEADEVFDPLPR